jgi:hypothetical protein
MSAEKDIGHLKIVKNDLLDRFLSQSRVYDLLFFQILTHSAAPSPVLYQHGSGPAFEGTVK